MSRARSHLRAALFLEVVSTRGATTRTAARRELSARPAPLKPGMEYQDAVRTLNTLQSNACYLKQRKSQKGDSQTKLEAMELYLARSGLQVEDLDRLNIIHITGTKGKGSTCAFTERILRSYGLKTGFFRCVSGSASMGSPSAASSSPSTSGASTGGWRRPRKPVVCGVSSLGIDHTSLLGDTVEKIAWQKGGIFKHGVPAFTVPQPDGPLAVLKERAEQISCPLYLCPQLEALEEGGPPLTLGLEGEHQRFNAALALQLARCWLQQKVHRGIGELTASRPSLLQPLPLAPVFQPTSHMRQGLRDTEWLGRSQMLRHGHLTWYLDGAHTSSSMQACVRWFRQALHRGERRGSAPEVRVLLFNSIGDRDPTALLKLLQPCQFDYAVFCPNLTEVSPTGNADQQNFTVTRHQMLLRCLEHQQHWRRLDEEHASPDLWSAPSPEPGGPASLRRPPCPPHTHSSGSLVFSCISYALQWITQGRDPVFQPPSPPQGLLAHPVAGSGASVLREAAAVHVLVTGSLHLVGGVLKLLEPSLSQ
ncbi:folylpolyglutamate synthase, mitochondrial isoform X5 [Rhinolophus sinicus]|uniref:folylpolyglutamate synthase, mitochondrial isoform X5 n=1 Tax=Rhinolophus sinicus TaxID=89399 RepID=UPI003D7A0FDC